MTIPVDNTTRPVNFIRFHGLTLLVVDNEGIEYLDPRQLCELAGMQWKGARRNLQEGDNVVLYGSKLLQRPVFDADGTSRCPGNEALYIRLDRSRMFMARINTNQMRSHGNAEAAEWLLNLQIEWANALHSYESNGIAVKKSNREARVELVGLMKARELATPTERVAFDRLIRNAMAEVGCVMEIDPQQALSFGAGE